MLKYVLEYNDFLLERVYISQNNIFKDKMNNARNIIKKQDKTLSNYKIAKMVNNEFSDIDLQFIIGPNRYSSLAGNGFDKYSNIYSAAFYPPDNDIKIYVTNNFFKMFYDTDDEWNKKIEIIYLRSFIHEYQHKMYFGQLGRLKRIGMFLKSLLRVSAGLLYRSNFTQYKAYLKQDIEMHAYAQESIVFFMHYGNSKEEIINFIKILREFNIGPISSIDDVASNMNKYGIKVEIFIVYMILFYDDKKTRNKFADICEEYLEYYSNQTKN